MKGSSRATVVFSCLGHLYIHLFTAFFFVIVLALEEEWRRPFHELIQLWTLGSLLVGVAALPAGLLSDRLGATTLMTTFFLGLGGASILAGLTRSSTSLMLALAGIGLFASIYHPVGIPWLVRNTEASRGAALGINGVFGSLGSALAGIVSGALIDAFGWRAAFVVPGAICVATGAALVLCLATGVVQDRKAEPFQARPGGEADARRVNLILLLTMFAGGLIYQGTLSSLPKVIELRQEGLLGRGALGVGALVALVYGAAGVMQVLGGYLADRLPLKRVYAGAILLQAPFLWLASTLGGISFIAVATVMVMANAAALPAESLLLARHTPENRHGLAFGVKFVLSFGAAPIAVELTSFISSRFGELGWLYVVFGFAAIAAFVFALFLPSEPRSAFSTSVLTERPAVPNME